MSRAVLFLAALLLAAVTAPRVEAVNCLTQAGLNLILSSEGFSSTFYNDAVGVKTIGYGTACHAFDCTTITPPITPQQAQDIMLNDIKAHYAPCVVSAVTVTINNNQFSALTSFVYNVGCGALRSSTLLAKVNANQWSEVPAQFLRWNKAGGQVLNGLTIRRQNEANMFSSTTTSPCADANVGTSNPDYGSCSFQGQSGTCKAVSSCTGGNMPKPNICSGPSYIQCCVPAPPPNYGSCTVTTGGTSIQGNCELDSGCTARGGTTTSGLCPGPANIKCCTFPQPTSYGACTVGSTPGKCLLTTQCSGTSTSGLCPGASNIQCCVVPTAPRTQVTAPPKYIAATTVTTSGACTTAPTASVPSQSGWCMDKTNCAVTTTAGLCPGSSNIQCCSYPGCTLSTGTKGTCMPTASCNAQGGTFTAGLCAGPADIKCCTWPTPSPGANGAALLACDLDQVNNCLSFGGTVASCYNNTGCAIPALAADIQFSATTDDWSEDGVIAHANITESNPSDGLSGAMRRVGTTGIGVAVALYVIAAVAMISDVW